MGIAYWPSLTAWIVVTAVQGFGHWYPWKPYLDRVDHITHVVWIWALIMLMVTGWRRFMNLLTRGKYTDAACH